MITQVILEIFSLLIMNILFMINNELYCLHLLAVSGPIYLAKALINSSMR